MNILDNLNELGNKIVNGLNLKNLQENFLQSNIGKIANVAIDTGIKALFPDFIEDEVIEVKNSLISGGIREGINTAIEGAIDIGKKALGIENKEFNNINEAVEAMKKGGLIGKISNSLDNVLDKLNNSNFLSDNIFNIIKGGKDLIMNNIETNVENEFANEMKAFQKLEKYIANWEKCYANKDMEGLKKEYNKIEKQMKKILPLEDIIIKVNKIENINELINNTKNFNFNNLYLELAGQM